jgi:hypothetical protein
VYIVLCMNILLFTAPPCWDVHAQHAHALLKCTVDNFFPPRYLSPEWTINGTSQSLYMILNHAYSRYVRHRAGTLLSC